MRRHGSTTTMYSKVFESLGMPSNSEDEKQIPLLGITATPYRSGDHQTNLLMRQYNKNVLSAKPKF